MNERAPRNNIKIPKNNEIIFEMLTYSIERIKKGFSNYNFTFYEKSKQIYLTENESSYFSSDIYYIKEIETNLNLIKINILEKNTKFLIFDKDNILIGEIQVIRPGGNFNLVRKWKIQILNDNKQINLFSKQPEINENGDFELYFGGKMIIPSVKNCILIDDIENFELIGLRKIQKNLLEIDSRSDIKSINLFVIGIISFLSK